MCQLDEDRRLVRRAPDLAPNPRRGADQAAKSIQKHPALFINSTGHGNHLAEQMDDGTDVLFRDWGLGGRFLHEGVLGDISAVHKGNPCNQELEKLIYPEIFGGRSDPLFISPFGRSSHAATAFHSRDPAPFK